jgi:PIN domain
VTPLPGASREHLLEVLRQAHYAAQNARGALAGPHDAYIRWADEARRLLRGQVSKVDLDRLVLTPTFWALQTRPSQLTDEWMRRLISAELDDRVAELEMAYAALDAQIKRWSRAGVFVVADSSFYIHHPEHLEALDLRQPLGLRDDPVHLLVPILVVDELDRLKESKDGRTRGRARVALAVLDRVLSDPTSIGVLRESDYSPLQDGGIPRGEVTVEIVFDPHGHDRLSIADDELVDRAVAVQALAGRVVRFITYDTGQSTRARAAGLEAVKLAPPDEEMNSSQGGQRRRTSVPPA